MDSNLIVFTNYGLGGVQRKILDLSLYCRDKKIALPILIFRDKSKFFFVKSSPRSQIILFSPYQGDFALVKHLVFFVFIFFQLLKFRPKNVLTFFHFMLLYLAPMRVLFLNNFRLSVSEDNIFSKYNQKPYTNQHLPNYLLSLLFSFVDQVIVQTEVAKTDLVKYLRVNPNQIQVVNNWVYSFKKQSFKKTTSKKWDIVFSGRLSPQKRLDLVLNVFSQVAMQNKQAKFLLLGDGDSEYTNKIKIWIKKYSLQKSLIWKKSAQDPRPVIGQSRFIIFCSDFEGQPMAILEAMSLGVVPLVKIFPGVKEYLKDGSDSVLAASCDSLSNRYLELTNNPSQIKKLSANAIVTSKKFGLENIKKTLQITFPNLA